MLLLLLLGGLARIGRWDLLPVQQRGSVRLLHHGGGGGGAPSEGLGEGERERKRTKLRRPVESTALHTVLELDHRVLLLIAGLFSMYL